MPILRQPPCLVSAESPYVEPRLEQSVSHASAASIHCFPPQARPVHALCTAPLRQAHPLASPWPRATLIAFSITPPQPVELSFY